MYQAMTGLTANETAAYPSPEHAHALDELKHIIQNGKSSYLLRKEWSVVRHRFMHEMTLAEVGDITPSENGEMSVSAERIRAIQKTAFRKLRHPKRNQQLKVFYENANIDLSENHATETMDHGQRVVDNDYEGYAVDDLEVLDLDDGIDERALYEDIDLDEPNRLEI
jgi:hypothetical protein